MTGRRIAILTAALLIATSPPRVARATTSASGKLSIEAKLDADRIAPGETATLTVEVQSEGLNLPDVPLPLLQSVTVERAGTAQNFSIINGRVSRTSTTVYRLIPRGEGAVTIPPLKIAVGGERAETSPLTLTVSHAVAPRTPAPLRGALPPGAAPAGTPEIFVKATVDHPRAYWNQQVTLRLRLYSRVDVIGDVDWRPPSTDGFWTEGLGPARQGRQIVNGKEYAVMEIPTALFPTRTGTLTIGSAQVRCRVARVIQPPDPWSMLAMPDVVPEDVSIHSEPISIVVDPLPAGAPPGFGGAVGEFRLAFHVDSLTARAGEPAAARVTITGTGNVATIRDPEIHARGASREYVVGTSTKVDRTGDRLAGEREHDVAFVADQPGTLEILPIHFAWFDPESRSYRSQSTETVIVKVLPGSGREARPGGIVPGGLAAAAPRRSHGPLGTLTLDPPAASVVLLGSSIVGFGAAVLTGRSRQRRFRDPRAKRRRALEAILGRDLSRSASLARSGEPAKAAARAEHAVLSGTGLRYDVELQGLARAERGQALLSRGAPDGDVAAIESLLTALQAIAYAPPETRVSDAKHAIASARRALERYRNEMAT
ncbi:MAG TPA: BatD family protein [Candidatus Binatia bacterium]|nr:BatD family protein [Candidatus Binatia bacterium]